MEKDVAKACHEEKLELLRCVFNELMAVLFAYNIEIILTLQGVSKRMTFSEALTLWNKWRYSPKRDIDSETKEKRIMAAVKDLYESESTSEVVLFVKGDKPEFQFSGEPLKFLIQLLSIMFLLFRAGEKGDPRVDLLAMKALYYASSMITRLELEGKRRTDIPYKAGRADWKKRVSKQDVIEAYYRIDTKHKSKNAICKAVREALISQEAKRGEKKKDVYSVKQIGRTLKEVLEKI